MRSRFLPLTGWLPILAALAIAVPGSSRADKPGGLPLFDGFDSKFALDWETIRPDPTHLSLKTHPGKLTITTQYGSMHGSQTTAKNLFLVDAPQGLGDFVVTARIENFLPEMRWQQAGLLFYNDDDHYLKWVRDYNQDSPDLNAYWEDGAAGQGSDSPIEVGRKRFWLRVIKRGNLYQCDSSPDGQTYTTYAVIPWADGSPKKVGLVAKNGPREGDLEAQFDFFELRKLTDAQRDDPVCKMRRALWGKWKAVARAVNGVAVTQGPVTRLIAKPGTLTLQEKGSLAMSYTVDPSTTPNRITLIPRRHGVGQLLNGVFSLEEDTLTLCLNPNPNGSAPDSLESVEGDGYLFLKLERNQDGQ